MDYFDIDDTNKEQKELFKKYYVRNRKVLAIMGYIFLGLGIVLLALGIALFIVLELLPMISLIIVGGVYTILGTIFSIVFKTGDPDAAYKKYQDRLNSFRPIYSMNEASSRVMLLEARVKRLEEEIESLKKNNHY